LNKYILVQEEYGYRHWLGNVPNNMTIEQIAEWWSSLNDLTSMSYNPSEEFIVPLYELEDVANEDETVAIWSWNDNQGKKHILNRDTIIAFFHVHEDDDSYMKIVNGGYVYHNNFDPRLENIEPLDLEEIQSLKEVDPITFEKMLAEYENKVNNMAINWLMRNIDLEINIDQNVVFSNKNTGNPLLIGLATHLRDEDLVETFHCEKQDVLDQWPLSISSYAMSLIPSPESIHTLVKNYKVTEENFNITLDIEVAKSIVKKVQKYAKENEESLLKLFCYQEERKDNWISFG
jgi:phage pi2 protein 07